MFCPFCKAEYRAGIAQCSDCSISLVDSIPGDAFDANFMVLLWNGESLRFLEAVCEELDRAGIAVASPRVEVLLRDPVDRYHLKQLKTFPYVLGVPGRSFPAARKILEAAARNTSPAIALPPVGAYPQPYDQTAVAARRRSGAPLDTTTTVASSADLRFVEFLEASFEGLGIATRRIVLEGGEYEIQVRPEQEEAARQVVEEIATGTSQQAAAASLEDSILQDGTPKSYFLAWFVPATCLVVFLAYGTVASGSRLVVLYLLGSSLSLVGALWMIYQAICYEVRPFRYCVAALLPFTFLWYYVERYSVRKGEQRLPISARVRLRPPAAS